ncbi:LOW QUALITY PROTEIN: M-phase phosphoprotein 9 [Danio aesculapii]|uniref:LOW QUALITY PROTEIN: M-phase phosphoprotein 9 n=1 Tax=Danio aesculapii TaxID=1142201 RepID=UPI0024BFF1B0|nr:LOW QUALITY PROTEIN: M-phase phosphoprotein 9 [Danio aesculapii]
MSTDDSISEDASSSVALSHEHGGKQSEASGGSSEDTVSAPHAIRSLCLGSAGRSLPFINPSSMETLRALVQEIQSSGETDPQIWRNCEGRWLHLFQLVEKQYQEQILAQQEQYQCQIQLIQDEIKALVQLQNRQTPPQDAARSPRPLQDPAESRSEEGMLTVESSGYGTLSAWEQALDSGRQEALLWSPNPSLTPSPSPGPQSTHKHTRISQPLTSWAQRHKQKRSSVCASQQQKSAAGSPEQTHTSPACVNSAVSLGVIPLQRADSVASETSGLSYWKLDESELYRPLPDNFQSASFVAQTPEEEKCVSLREIYQNRRADPRGTECDATAQKLSGRTSICTSPSRFSSVSGTGCNSSAGSSVCAHEDECSQTATLTVQQRAPAQKTPPAARKRPTDAPQDPIVLSLLRQNLREKHSRHISDLRAYYEAEICSLKEKLELQDLPLDLQKSNQMLMERCQHLERALTEASTHIRELEVNKQKMEKQLTEWSERYSSVSSSVQLLHARVQESERSRQQQERSISRLQSRMQEQEEELQSARRAADQQEAQRSTQHRRMQELLHEYDSLRREHEGAKDKLSSAESKLCDASEQICELKRVICKLETQVRQLQHESVSRTRQSVHSHTQPSGAGLLHHPDLLQRPLEADVRNGSPSDSSSRGSVCPAEREQQECRRRDAPVTPLMKILMQTEDSRATDGRALSTHTRSSATKRDTLLTPLSAKSSPKRCPSENFSTAFGRPLPSHEHLQSRFDVERSQPSPRKRLQFRPSERREGKPQSSLGSSDPAESSESEGPASGLWQEVEQEEEQDEEVQMTGSADVCCQPRVRSLSDAERLLDELTQEKQQIESTLSRIPGAGARVTLQSRLDQVSLEQRLEQVNSDLGFIRMTLKRFHILRSSANL